VSSRSSDSISPAPSTVASSFISSFSSLLGTRGFAEELPGSTKLSTAVALHRAVAMMRVTRKPS
jgi:hypothetical protein